MSYASECREEIIPFAPSIEWYAAWWSARRSGMPERQAIAYANDTAKVSGKDFSRCMIESNNNVLLLSVAIEGGATVLKKKSRIHSATLSEHGNWRHVHLGALEAAYGRAPYYSHLYPMLQETYLEYAHSLSGFNTLVHRAVCRFLDIPGNEETFLPEESADSGNELIFPCNVAALERGKELLAGVDTRLSVIDALMRTGKETLLVLEALRHFSTL